MRTFHRLLALVAALVMLHLGLTGSLIQIVDLYTLAMPHHDADATMQSINEGRFGNPNFQILSPADFSGQALPATLDIPQSMGVVLSALHRQAPQAKPTFLELRMADGRVIGQAKLGKTITAFDVATGVPAAPAEIKALRPPRSLRQQLKELHRFWGPAWGRGGDTPGVWFELLSGIVLWILLISGLMMYVKLWRGRAKLDRKALFWSAGGVWKTLHRGVSVGAVVFLAAIAFSGTWIGFESVWRTTPFRARSTAPISGPLSDSDVRQMTAATVQNFRRLEPSTPIKVLRIRRFGDMSQGGVVTATDPLRQVVFDTRTGQVVTLTEPAYPPSGFPFGEQTHEDIKHFHSGDMFGVLARLLSLTGGLSLVYLSVSGLVMYVQLYQRRAKNGRKGLVWVG